MPKSRVRKKRPSTQDRPVWTRGGPNRFTMARGSGSGVEQFDDWLTEAITPLAAVIATAIVLCATLILAHATIALDRDTRAFENAPLCNHGQSAGCLTPVPATIQLRGQLGGQRAPSIYYVQLSGAAPANGHIQMAGQNALWNVARAGDEVTAFVRNRAVVRIEDAGVSGDTTAAPSMQSMLAEGFLISGVVWTLAALYLLLRVCGVGWSRPLIAAGPLLFVAVISFPVGALIGHQSESLAVAMGTGLGIVAFAAVIQAFVWLRSR